MGMTKIFPALLLLVLIIGIVSPLTTTLSPTTISKTIKQGEIQTATISYTITNDLNTSSTVNINSGNLPSFITSSTSSISVPANNQVSGSITLTYTPTTSTNAQTYSGNLYIGSEVVSTTTTVTADLTGQCKIYTLPIPLSKTLESGTTSSQSIDVYVSKYCSSALQVSTNQPQRTKPITFQVMSGLVEPGQKFSVTIYYDTKDAQTGTYTDNLIISAVDEDEKTYSLNLPISLTITNSISPITNTTFSQMPSCSVSASELSLNTTAKLICNNIEPNIDIMPVIDSSYLTGLNVEETESTYTYNFKPKVIGNTNITAKFIYKNAEIGTPFTQQIRIISGGAVIPGTMMEFRFYPELYESNGDITIRVIDNSTGNILNDAKIYMNGIQIFNNSVYLEKARSYELRANSFGYQDIVKSIALNPNYINFSIKDIYEVGEVLNFTTEPSGANIQIDGGIITLPFSLSSQGTHTITVSKLGYTTTSKNISVIVTNAISYYTDDDQRKVGKELLIETTKNSSLVIKFIEDGGTTEESLIPKEITSTRIKVDIEKAGTYNVYDGSKLLGSYLVPKSSLWTRWYMLLAYGLLALIIVWFLFSDSGKSNATKTNFTMEG